MSPYTFSLVGRFFVDIYSKIVDSNTRVYILCYNSLKDIIRCQIGATLNKINK